MRSSSERSAALVCIGLPTESTDPPRPALGSSRAAHFGQVVHLQATHAGLRNKRHSQRQYRASCARISRAENSLKSALFNRGYNLNWKTTHKSVCPFSIVAIDAMFEKQANRSINKNVNKMTGFRTTAVIATRVLTLDFQSGLPPFALLVFAIGSI